MSENIRKTTQIDEGWRKKDFSRVPTQIDSNWRGQPKTENDNDPMRMADAKAFHRFEEFAEAVKNVKELTSTSETHYQVVELIRQGGESVILKCVSGDGSETVAKIYFNPINSLGSSIEARKRVLEYMQTKEGQEYTLPVIDQGTVELRHSNYYFDITRYCPEGDISQWKNITFKELVDVIERINEAIHSFHQAGILHRDIKPENLLWENGKIVFSDFGLAKVVNSKVSNVSVGTEGYRAPETLFTASTDESAFFFDEKCDYYSFGVTLGSLFEGKNVYEGMNAAMITLCIRNSTLPLTRVIEERTQLENLLHGLCQYDPNRRFGYEDVKRWLKDHQYRGNCDSEDWPRAFRMLGEEFRDEKSLFLGITEDKKHWDEGLELLYSKYFENFFKPFRTDIAREAQNCEEAFRSDDRDKGLAMFLKKLYPAGPLVWKGYTFDNLQMLADKMAVTKTPLGYAELLQNSLISHWIINTEGINVDEEILQTVMEIELTAQTFPQIACYWFGNTFAEQKSLRICRQDIHSMSELFPALFESAYEFYFNDGYQKLMKPEEDGALYGFLYSFGYKEALESAMRKCRKVTTYEKCGILFALLERIAATHNVDAAIVRRFFVNYGPIGGALYTRQLVLDDNIYCAFDSLGRKTLDEIKDFKLPEQTDIGSMMSEFRLLAEKVNRLQNVLVDNPFCIEAGVYEKRLGTILCNNLKGVFAFYIHGQLMPLGFEAWIRKNKKGE